MFALLIESGIPCSDIVSFNLTIQRLCTIVSTMKYGLQTIV